jgi:hypothetical protein
LCVFSFSFSSLSAERTCTWILFDAFSVCYETTHTSRETISPKRAGPLPSDLPDFFLSFGNVQETSTLVFIGSNRFSLVFVFVFSLSSVSFAILFFLLKIN